MKELTARYPYLDQTLEALLPLCREHKLGWNIHKITIRPVFNRIGLREAWEITFEYEDDQSD